MQHDVAIIGAGPAGSAAARLLASWKHRVVLLHRSAHAGNALAESIPPSCRKLLAACRLLEPVEAAGFYRSSGNTVWWGSNSARSEHFEAGELGYQVDRSAFDDLLRREAVAAGVELRAAFVRDARVDGDGAHVELDADASLRARFVLDCSGRAGVIARRGWRTDLGAHPRTVALIGVWKSARPWPSVDPTHTLVESHDDGWIWSVPLAANLRYVTAMVDPQRTHLARGLPAADVYAAEVAKAPHIAALMRDATLDRAPWGCDASVYDAHTFAADPMLLVGDAASFIDPLSSYGIKKALASAWLAAVAVHTSLKTPSMTSAALDFFAERERAMAASIRRQSREQFQDAASTHAHLFWTERSTDTDLPMVAEPDTRALREDPRVRQAFMWLKAQDALALRPSPRVRREPHAIVRGHEIIMEDRLVSGGREFRFLRDVDLVGLLELAPAHDEVPALFDAYNRRFPPVALPDFLGALSVLIAFGMLEGPPR